MSGMLATGIPFRHQSSTDLESVALALGVTAVVLVAFVVVAWLGRQRGWWRRWSVATALSPNDPDVVVEQVIVVSRETRVFVLRRGEQRWLLSESSRSTAWSPALSSTRAEVALEPRQ
jgi:hypothetical protein